MKKMLKNRGKLEKLFEETIEGVTNEHGGLELWTELKILRNHIIHSAYFETSKKGGRTSKATATKLEAGFYKPYIDRNEECTMKWRLSINPLRVSRYESLVSLMFFYWYGKTTGVWISNNPLDTPDIDCRMRYNISWIDRDDYHRLVGEGKDFIYLIGYLAGRLSPKHFSVFSRLAGEVLGIDITECLRSAKGILQIFENDCSISRQDSI